MKQPLVNIPSVADTNCMIHIAQSEFKEFVSQYGARIGESEERVIGEDGSETHSPSMEDGFSTEATQTDMTMDNFYLFANYDISEHGKEWEDVRERCFTIDYEKWNMVDFEAVGEIPDTCSSFVCMSDDDDFMSTVDQFLMTSVRDSSGQGSATNLK